MLVDQQDILEHQQCSLFEPDVRCHHHPFTQKRICTLKHMHLATSQHSSSPAGFHDAPDDGYHSPAASFILSADPHSSCNHASPKQLLKSFLMLIIMIWMTRYIDRSNITSSGGGLTHRLLLLSAFYDDMGVLRVTCLY